MELNNIKLGVDSDLDSVQAFVDQIVAPDGEGLESQWQKNAHALLMGLVVFELAEAAKQNIPATLAGIDFRLSPSDEDAEGLWEPMLSCKGPLSHVAVDIAQEMLGRSSSDVEMILSTTRSYLMEKLASEEALAIVEEKILDTNNVSFLAEFSPEEAELAGAFVEDALTESEAIDSTIDFESVG